MAQKAHTHQNASEHPEQALCIFHFFCISQFLRILSCAHVGFALLSLVCPVCQPTFVTLLFFEHAQQMNRSQKQNYDEPVVYLQLAAYCFNSEVQPC